VLLASLRFDAAEKRLSACALTMTAAADLIRATMNNRSTTRYWMRQWRITAAADSPLVGGLAVTETIPHSRSNDLGATRHRQRDRRRTRFSTPTNREPIRAPPGEPRLERATSSDQIVVNHEPAEIEVQ